MIRYALNCDQGHTFESWFANSAAYDKQAKRGLVACPICGSAKVEKAIMAPNLAAKVGDSGTADPGRPPRLRRRYSRRRPHQSRRRRRSP